MKNKLMSISRTNLLYLPVMKINTTLDTRVQLASPEKALVVAVDKTTEDKLHNVTGVTFGANPAEKAYIRIDQGLDTREISPSFNLDNDLVENQYIIELDSRLGRIAHRNGANLLEESFIDDDQIATYFVSTADNTFVGPITDKEVLTKYATGNDGGTAETVIAGPRGTFLQFTIRATIDLNSSTYLFEKFGTTNATTVAGTTATQWGYLDTIVRVTGATTGYRLDIPVRFAKLIAE